MLTIHLPLWGIALLSLVALFWIASSVGRSRGQWDFVSPFYGLAIFGAGVIFWAALFIGRCSK